MADCPHCGNSLFYLRTEQKNESIKVVLECMDDENLSPKCKEEFYAEVDLKNLKHKEK